MSSLSPSSDVNNNNNTKKKINFITGNANKLREFTQIIGDFDGYEFVCTKLDLPEYQGEPEEIAREKCKTALAIINEPVLVEDSSLGFNALHGLPGPYVKWFVDKLKPKGLCRLLDGFEDKSAYAMCIYAYGEPNKEVKLFVGKANGKIVEPRGQAEFGWTPVFEPDGYNETYAEMKKSLKNQISHRHHAIVALKSYLADSRL